MCSTCTPSPTTPSTRWSASTSNRSANRQTRRTALPGQRELDRSMPRSVHLQSRATIVGLCSRDLRLGFFGAPDEPLPLVQFLSRGRVPVTGRSPRVLDRAAQQSLERGVACGTPPVLDG